MAPKVSQNQISELKETKKMKVVQLHESTPKSVVEPYPNPKNNLLGPPKLKKIPQNQVKIKYKN